MAAILDYQNAICINIMYIHSLHDNNYNSISTKNEKLLIYISKYQMSARIEQIFTDYAYLAAILDLCKWDISQIGSRNIPDIKLYQFIQF